MSSCGWLPLVLFLLLVSACTGGRSVTSDPVRQPVPAAVDWPLPVANAALDGSGAPLPLEVAIVVFEPGVLEMSERDARHTLRRVETRLAAVYLRDVLTESNRWGPVRVLPEENQFAAVTVTGSIVHSDGRDLVLDIQARDATGRAWFDERFRGQAVASDYQVQSTHDPFRRVFIAIANRLRQVALELDDAEVARLQDVARMRYAVELAPDAFSGYLEQDQGRFSLARLPAESDPMLARIERIRNQEALFIDTVDEQYVDLRQELGPTYDLWRRSSFEQAEYLEAYKARASTRELSAPRGSYAAMQQVYSAYRSVRIQEQDLFELATGFDNETAPTVMSTGERVVQLSGSLDSQYREWRNILAQIIQIERAELL